MEASPCSSPDLLCYCDILLLLFFGNKERERVRVFIVCFEKDGLVCLYSVCLFVSCIIVCFALRFAM